MQDLSAHTHVRGYLKTLSYCLTPWLWHMSLLTYPLATWHRNIEIIWCCSFQTHKNLKIKIINLFSFMKFTRIGAAKAFTSHINSSAHGNTHTHTCFDNWVWSASTKFPNNYCLLSEAPTSPQVWSMNTAWKLFFLVNVGGPPFKGLGPRGSHLMAKGYNLFSWSPLRVVPLHWTEGGLQDLKDWCSLSLVVQTERERVKRLSFYGCRLNQFGPRVP